MNRSEKYEHKNVNLERILYMQMTLLRNARQSPIISYRNQTRTSAKPFNREG